MKFLVIGLGSMGKRRVRCLKALGYNDIVGYDLREDRRKEAMDTYHIETVSDLSSFDFTKVYALIISTPPHIHNQYIRLAIEKKKPAFVEASVVLKGLEDLKAMAEKAGVYIAPSCTLKFHPAIKDIKEIVTGGKYGKLTNFSYHSGQYLPDWHPWEGVKDYYVSRRDTGGCREIVPFELTWIVDILGLPVEAKGYFGKTMDIGADIDDTYVISMKWPGAFGSLTVDVVSRYATRSLILNMEYGQVLWRWDDNTVKVYDSANERWVNYGYREGKVMAGYNRNIIEDMYIDELRAFIDSIGGKAKYPSSLGEDIGILKVLNAVEGYTND